MKPFREALKEIVRERTGIRLDATWDSALEAHLHGRLKARGLSAAEYLSLLRREPDSSEEVSALFGAVTTGKTCFFRHREQLDAVRILMGRAARAKGGGAVSVLSLGTATGEEAYTLAMIAVSVGVKTQILGADLNVGFLDAARTGIYRGWSLEGVTPAELETHFDRAADGWRVKPSVQASVSFTWLNFVTSPFPTPRDGPWDIVLFRNVLIYLDAALACRLVRKIEENLSPEGCLVVGPSETLHPALERFTSTRVEDAWIFLPPNGKAGEAQARAAWGREGPGHPPPRPPRGEPARDRARGPTQVEAALRELERGNAQGSSDLCARALEDDPLSVETHFFLGLARKHLADPEGAERHFRAVLFLSGESPPALLELAALTDGAGRSGEAVSYLRRFLRAVEQPESEACFRRSPYASWARDLPPPEVLRKACHQRIERITERIMAEKLGGTSPQVRP